MKINTKEFKIKFEGSDVNIIYHDRSVIFSSDSQSKNKKYISFTDNGCLEEERLDKGRPIVYLFLLYQKEIVWIKEIDFHPSDLSITDNGEVILFDVADDKNIVSLKIMDKGGEEVFSKLFTSVLCRSFIDSDRVYILSYSPDYTLYILSNDCRKIIKKYQNVPLNCLDSLKHIKEYLALKENFGNRIKIEEKSTREQQIEIMRFLQNG